MHVSNLILFLFHFLNIIEQSVPLKIHLLAPMAQWLEHPLQEPRHTKGNKNGTGSSFADTHNKR